jgi:hypothetical protein
MRFWRGNGMSEEKVEALKQHAIQTLRKVANYLEKGEYEKIKPMVEYSPAGDGYGCDNHFINLSNTEQPMDIMELISELQWLEENPDYDEEEGE